MNKYAEKPHNSAYGPTEISDEVMSLFECPLLCVRYVEKMPNTYGNKGH